MLILARYPRIRHLGDFAAMNEYDFALDFNEPSGFGEYTGDLDGLAELLDASE